MSANALKTETVSKERRVQDTLARSTIYQFLSLCFGEPNEETFPILKDKEYLENVQESLESYLAIDRLSGADKDTSSIKKAPQLIVDCLNGKSVEDVNTEYSKRFGSYISSKECPIYDTFYGKLDIFQQTQELADITGFYRAFDLKHADDVKKDKLDHLSIELEFLHYLTYKEAYALENHGDEQLDICVSAEKKFMKSHLGRWIGHFALLVNKHSQEGFYANSANLLKDFVELEWKYLRVKPEEVKELNDEAFNVKTEDFQCGPDSCETGLNVENASL
ncbi:MAG: TorD/DmsD family molecular chaperone [Candidatus Brocadiales bacterium]